MPNPRQITESLWASKSEAAKPAVAPPDFIDPNFPHQTALLLDEAALIACLCTRRAAKSFSAIKRLLRAMFKHPGCSCLFLGLTRETAKRVVWKDTLRILNRDMKLGGKFNKNELSFTLPNGSVLYILGVDADDSEKEKLLGQKYAEVAIDESASYSIDLHELIYGVLKPAVADYRGTIGMYGTPGNLKNGIFFNLTTGKNPSKPERWIGQTLHEGVTFGNWSGHCWSTLQNPYMAEKWKQEIADLIRDNPLIEATPTFQQNYLGLWVIDESKLVYKYMPIRNDYNGTLPAFGYGQWHFVLAIDLGFTDATSFTVLAYHDNDRTLYGISSEKKPGLDLTAKCEHADSLKARWPIEQVVIDGSNKDAVEEMNNRHNLEAIAADKRDKFEFIDIMNDEYIQGRIKLSPECQPLKDEYAKLVVDERKLMKRKREEHAGCENHCADGTLYGWRYTWQYLSVEKPPPPKRNSPEAIAAELKATEDQLEEAMNAEFEQNATAQREAQEMNEWQ
jgi:hypothetical protein